ncbi:VanZ family protein [Arenimonas oryziterrae]|uniref:VanZ-like domain-containing protein n=1 Tax=Arenimonas oryziterrae DSM 21050 = YC6267 TaxID=1121015 RepID=A0A091AXZ4_9GAMM|nr:VanZ family protein [Arenimonas oryziterrae]KFN43494.1 hypothetical protein N789_09470 [Arenimonas oryziterrae DSM 21050 = YC6267]
MREFSWPRLWLGVWIFGWLLCITLSLVHPPQMDLDLPDSDKIGHCLAYGTLSAWAVLIFRTHRARLGAALSLIALGIAMEFAQGLLTDYRMMDARDALANTLGVLLGQALALTSAQDWLQQWDRRWAS